MIKFLIQKITSLFGNFFCQFIFGVDCRRISIYKSNARLMFTILFFNGLWTWSKYLRIFTSTNITASIKHFIKILKWHQQLYLEMFFHNIANIGKDLDFRVPTVWILQQALSNEKRGCGILHTNEEQLKVAWQMTKNLPVVGRKGGRFLGPYTTPSHLQCPTYLDISIR